MGPRVAILLFLSLRCIKSGISTDERVGGKAFVVCLLFSTLVLRTLTGLAVDLKNSLTLFGEFLKASVQKMGKGRTLKLFVCRGACDLYFEPLSQTPNSKMGPQRA